MFVITEFVITEFDCLMPLFLFIPQKLNYFTDVHHLNQVQNKYTRKQVAFEKMLKHGIVYLNEYFKCPRWESNPTNLESFP